MLHTTSLPQQYDTDWEHKYGCYSVSLLQMNITRKENKQRSTWSQINGITTCVLVVFVVITNSMFILGLVKTNKRNLTLAQKLFIYMSAVDLLNGSFAMPYLAVFSFNGISCPAMSFMLAFTAFTVLSSTSALALISIIRLRSIIDPFSSRNGKRLTILVIIQGVVAIGLAGIMFENYLQASSLFYLVPLTSGISVLLFTLQAGVIGCNIYSLVYLRRQKHNRLQYEATQHCKTNNATKVHQFCKQQIPYNRKEEIKVQEQTPESHKGNNYTTKIHQLALKNDNFNSSAGARFIDKQSKYHHEAAKTLLMISVFQSICLIAQLLLSVLVYYRAGNTEIHLTDFIKVLDLFGTLKMLIDLNAGMNALICLCRSQKIQKYYRQLAMVNRFRCC